MVAQHDAWKKGADHAQNAPETEFKTYMWHLFLILVDSLRAQQWPYLCVLSTLMFARLSCMQRRY